MWRRGALSDFEGTGEGRDGLESGFLRTRYGWLRSVIPLSSTPPSLEKFCGPIHSCRASTARVSLNEHDINQIFAASRARA